MRECPTCHFQLSDDGDCSYCRPAPTTSAELVWVRADVAVPEVPPLARRRPAVATAPVPGTRPYPAPYPRPWTGTEEPPPRNRRGLRRWLRLGA
ncbi:MAG: hypothetical protein U0Q22_09960 [Acidimicrobiales bacterium]